MKAFPIALKTVVADTDWLRALLAMGLGLSGFLVNQVHVDLGWGLHLLLGNALALLAIRTCGRLPATAAISIASVETIILWNHPWAWLIWTIEGACIAFLYRRSSPIMIDLLFWLVIGGISLFVTYHMIMNMSGFSLWLVIAKQIFNGIFNVVLAEIIYLAVIGALWPNKIGKFKTVFDTVSVKAAAAAITLFFILLPMIVHIMFVSNRMQKQFLKEVSEKLHERAETETDSLSYWLDLTEAKLAAAGLVSLEGHAYENSTTLKNYLDTHFDYVAILDDEGLPETVLVESAQGRSDALRFLTTDLPITPALRRDRTMTVSTINVASGKPLKVVRLVLIVPVSSYGRRAFVLGVPAVGKINDLFFNYHSDVDLTLFDSSGDHVSFFYRNNFDTVGNLIDIDSFNIAPNTKYNFVPTSSSNFGTTPMSYATNAILFKKIPQDFPKGWSLVSSVRVAPYVESAREQHAKLLTINLLIVLLIFITANFFGWKIQRSIIAIGQTATQITTMKSTMALDRFSFFSEVKDLGRGLNNWYEIIKQERIDAERFVQKLKLISNFAPVIIYETSYDEVSGQLARRFVEGKQNLFGYSLVEMSTPDWWRNHVVPTPGEVKEPDFSDRNVGAAVFFERVVRTKGGQQRWVADTHVFTDMFNGTGFFLDITELKNAEKQLLQASKLSALGEMATGMAHELNQPLNVIKLSASNLLEVTRRGTVTEKDLNTRLSRIIKQSDRAANLISHMRIFGRAPDSEAIPFNVSDAVNGALSMIGARLREEGTLVELRIEPDLSTVMGHSVLLEQVILNLLLNSRDAIENVGQKTTGRGYILVAAHNSNKSVIVSVTDNGGGVEEEIAEHLFEPFFTTKGPGKGTGLGLSISFGIIRDMGGSISAENIEGGLKVTLVLPAGSVADRSLVRPAVVP